MSSTAFDAFLDAYWADQDAGRQRSLDEYLRLFPRAATRIREEAQALGEQLTRVKTALSEDRELRELPRLQGFPVIDNIILYDRLGRGGMGAVYLGWHLHLDQAVAVKVTVAETGARSLALADRFRREARVAARLDNENLVRVIHARFGNELAYLVMELVLGADLREWLTDAPLLPESTALAIFAAAAQGVAAAHAAGIVHRDIKPSNILLSLDGQVKVADLGLARALDSHDDLTGPSGMPGTPSYMAPELFETRREAAFAPTADVYALGATLYFLLVGRDAIPGDLPPSAMMHRVLSEPFPDVRAARPDVDEALADLVRRLTARDPGDRFADAGEIVRWLDDGPLSTTRRSESRISGLPSLSPPPLRPRPTQEVLDVVRRELEAGGAARSRPPAAGDSTEIFETPAATRTSRSRRTPRQDQAPDDPAEATTKRRAVLALALLLTGVGSLAWALTSRPRDEAPPDRADSPHREQVTPSKGRSATRRASADRQLPTAEGDPKKKADPAVLRPPDEGEVRALITAVAADDAGRLKALIAQGIDVNVALDDGETALLEAVEQGSLRCLDVLLNRPHPPMNHQRSRDGLRPLFACVERDRPEALRRLIAAGAATTGVDRSGRTLLHVAAHLARAGLIDALVAQGLDVNARVAVTGRTPLHEAVLTGDVETVRALLRVGARPDLRDGQRRSSRDLGIDSSREAIRDLFR